MFWRRKTDETPPPAEKPRARSISSGNESVEEDLGAAIDALSSIVRVYGERAFDVGELDATVLLAECAGWAKHLQLRVAPPGLPDDPEAGPHDRDFAGVARYMNDRRTTESEAVRRSLGDLRDVIGRFVDGLGNTVLADRTAASRVGVQLSKLREAVDGSSTERLKREAAAAIVLVEQVSEERRERQRAQVEDLGQRLRAMRGELRVARERMQVDALTQVYNRAALDDRIMRQSALGVVLDQSACLMLVDIDHFKWANDKFGHPTGDAVLKELGRCLSRCFLRKEDFVARYGGDEFAVVIAEDSIDTARVLGERLLDSIRDLEVRVDDTPLKITASVGIARLEPGEDVASWLERADRALYQAKEGGRDRLCVDGGRPGTPASNTPARAADERREH